MAGSASCLWLLLLGNLALSPLPSVALSYEGYRMYSVAVKTAKEVDQVVNIADQLDGVSILNEPRHGKITLVVTAGEVTQLRSKVADQGLEVKLEHGDVQGLIDATKRAVEVPVLKRAMEDPATHVVDHSMYHRYTEIVSMLEELSTSNPDLMEISTLPHLTHEGRAVTLVKLHGNSTTYDHVTSNKPAVVIESGIHAREWITPAVQLWVIEALLQGYRSGDPTLTSMLDSLDWYIIPVTNPDGYEFSHSEDRMWRKNRRYISFECKGVDLNRNFDVAFNTTGISNNCLRNTYLGFKPFSEPETSNVKSLVDSLRTRLVAYLAVHSYSQLILVPWGYSEQPLFPENYEDMDRIATLMQAAIQLRHGTQWLKGQAYPLLGYAASGAGEDWALKEVPGIFATCLELRPRWDDPRMFLLPPDEIVPSSEEYFDSLVAMANELQAKP